MVTPVEGHDVPRIAVVGAGAWGLNHVRVWHDLGLLVKVCDVSPDQLDRARACSPAVETTTSVEDAIHDPGVSAVVVATPAPSHAAIATLALRAGKDVLVEKPMALSAAEAREMDALAVDQGAILMVNHVLEFHPAVLALQRLLREGALGKVLYLYSQRLNLGRVRTEENALWSFAPHDVALLLRLLGTMPEEVACHGGAYLSSQIADVTLMSLKFPGGVRAHVFVSWLHPFKEHRFVLVGDRQMAVFDDTAPRAEKLLLYPHRVEWLDGRVPVARKAEAVAVDVEGDEPLSRACLHFAECVRSRRRPLTDPASAVRVLEVLEAAERSLASSGTAVTPPASRLASSRAPDVHVHPTATVDEGAQIGDGTKIWHYTHVMADARIGRACSLGQNVFVGRGVSVGDRVKIQNNVSVYEGVTLEDDVFCGPSVVFTNVLNPRSVVDRKSEYRPTLVKKGATLGANSTVICGVTIGRHSLVGAGAVVTRDVPDHGLVLGVPARLTSWVCECGEPLEGRDGGTCDRCGSKFLVRDESVLERVPE